MYLSNNNPHIFIRDLVQAIQDGWRTLDTNEGTISQAFILELKLFKDVDVTITEQSDYKVTITEHDAQKFILALQNILLQGFEVDLSSLRWDSMSVKSINAKNPLHPHAQKYDFHFLNELEWDELKVIAKTFGITGRNRLIIVNAVLAAQEKMHESRSDS